MGKHNGYTSKNKTDTKILFKKSNITIRTHSRTCSDASQITKSGVLHIKKNLSKCNDYYTDGNVIKRDLSVETGVCILRRYYKSKHKRDRCSKPTSLVKSKCSTVADTEFAEFKPELACGDSTNKFEIIDQANALNIDITSLMVENLKSLLNEWIRKHVLEDTQTKKKLISVLDSILQSLGSKVSEVRSSCSTYVIERNGTGCRVRDRKTATTAVTCQYCNKKLTSVITDASSSIIFKRFSRFTIPFPYKHVRIISTLSIPRNMNKKYKNKEKHMVYKVKKQKKQAPPMNAKKDRKIVINVSSCGMSTCSKKSWEQVPKGSEKKPPSKKRGIIFLPQMFYKSATDCTSTTEIEGVKKNVVTHENHLDTMPSLVKSIFADDPANVTSTDQVVNDNRKDNFTTTSLPRLSSEKLMNCVSNLQHHEAKYECCKESTPINVNQTYKSHTKIDFVNQSIEFPNITIHEQNSVTKQFTRESYFAKPKFRKKLSRQRKPLQKTSRKHSSKYDYESIKFKQFSYLYKKFKNTRKNDEIFSHFRNIFEYFANYKSNKDIKLEIHCNVYPFFDIEEKYSNSNLIINDTKVYPEYEVKTIPSAAHTIVHAIATTDSDLKERNNLNAIQTQPIQKPEIIALLDGAASQAKYIFKSENSTSTSDNSLKCLDSTEKGTTMTGLEVSKELSELKSAINDLSATAQKIVLEHKKRQSEKNKNEVNSSSEQKATLVESEKRVVKNANVSKGIQFSNFTKPAPKVQLLSGIKLSKEPKKTEDSLNRLKKKSSSYHIIDSESILKVTDMTAFPDKSIESNKAKPEKSKSLLQITDEKNKQKLIAFINKEARRVEKNKNDQMVFTMCPTSSSCYTPRLPPCMDYPHAMTCPYKSRSNKASQLTLPVNLSHFQGCNHTYCSSVYDIAKTNPTITVKRRSSIRFWEGLLYCILLWIPLIVIIYFFSAHIHELRKGLASNKTDKTSTKTTKKNDTSSRLLLQLADFGF